MALRPDAIQPGCRPSKKASFTRIFIIMKRSLAALAVVFFIACGSKPPAAPTQPQQTPPPPTATPTRIIGLSGTMAFGSIDVGSSFEAVLRINNTGNSAMTVTGMTGPSGYAPSWTSGSIAAGGSQAVTVRFSPTEERTSNGTLTVSADQTSGTNTMAVSGTGTRPPGPRTSFGAGRYLVGSDVMSGRYFSDPSTSGCYWERQSGLGGSSARSSRMISSGSTRIS